MTDENIKLLRKDIEHLLSEEYGSNYRIIHYDPRPSLITNIFGITLTVEVKMPDETFRLAHVRKSTNNEVMAEVRNQIGEQLSILQRHYL
jgi:hypothetical protein